MLKSQIHKSRYELLFDQKSEEYYWRGIIFDFWNFQDEAEYGGNSLYRIVSFRVKIIVD